MEPDAVPSLLEDVALTLENDAQFYTCHTHKTQSEAE